MADANRRIAGLAVLLLLTGCGEDRQQFSSSRSLVAVSIPPHAWLVERIGGDRVEVLTVVQPGESPATYQPTDAQVSRVVSAAAYFRAGVPFENSPWFEALTGAKQLVIVDTRDDIVLRSMSSHAGHDHADHDHGAADHDAHGGKDPHVWLSPQRLKTQAKTIAETLSKLNPRHAEEFATNLSALTSELDRADSLIRQKLKPLEGTAFYVFHPAWGYFADDYGLRQVAVEVGGREPTDHEMTRLQEQARAEGANVVFVQPQIAGASAEAIASAIGGRVEVLDPLSHDIVAELLRAAGILADSFRERRSEQGRAVQL